MSRRCSGVGSRRAGNRVRRRAALVGGFALLLGGTAAQGDDSWARVFRRIVVPPVQRSETTKLVEAGRIATGGFSEIVLSLGGEFQEGVPPTGTVGVVLIPDEPWFLDLLRNDRRFVFPIELRMSVEGIDDPIFFSQQKTASVAFPYYRVFLYNETRSGATLTVYAYRSR